MSRDPLYNFRMPVELREAVTAKAAAEGRAVSEVIRVYLERWVAQPPRPHRDRRRPHDKFPP